MSLIEKLVIWRLNQVEKMLGITIKQTEQLSWYDINQISKQLFLQDCADDCSWWDCYVYIRNIIWKNIVNFRISYSSTHPQKTICAHMLHSNNSIEFYVMNNRPILNRDYLLYSGGYYTINLNKAQRAIINYLLLTNYITISYLISDLNTITKWYIFDIILIK